jgi:hypothetical protein
MITTEAPRCIQPMPGIGCFMPPPNVLDAVFTPEVRQAWRSKPTDDLVRRLNILCACGPYPSDRSQAANLRYNRARKAAWEAYLLSSFACGLFEGSRGQDLRRRLAGRGEEELLAAIAECMACWFLGGRLKLPLWADAPGRDGRNLDMRVDACTDTGVEVKAPFRERPLSGAWNGDDSDKITQAMDAANKQFTDDRPNILVLVPCLRLRMFTHRRDLLKGAFGQSKITWQINTHTGEAGPTEVKFFPDGRFLNTTTPKGRALKADGFPAYRRISAIVCIEETIAERYPFPDPMPLLDEEQRGRLWPLWERARDLHFSAENRAWIEHNVLVLHNPYAYHAISHELFCQYPQLIPVGDQMQWTDGEEVIV